MNTVLGKIVFTCDQVRNFMYDYLDEKLPTFTSTRFHLHLNLCTECRQYLFLYKKAANAKAFRDKHPAPEEFLNATMDFLKKEGVLSREESEQKNLTRDLEF